MKPVEYPIKAIQQNAAECMQTAATQLLSFFDSSITLKKVIEEVPIYVENGEKDWYFAWSSCILFCPARI